MGSKEWNGFIIYQSSAPFLTKQCIFKAAWQGKGILEENKV